MACYSAAGFTWGATMGTSAPASVIVCNSAFGTCQAACAAVYLAPTLWGVGPSRRHFYTKTCWLWTGLANWQKESEKSISQIFTMFTRLKYHQKQKLVLWRSTKAILPMIYWLRLRMVELYWSGQSYSMQQHLFFYQSERSNDGKQYVLSTKQDSFPISVLTDAIAYMYAPTSNYD